METIWNRIESWLKVEATEICIDLLPGATEKEIHDMEEFVGIEMPSDVKSSFSIHNGQLGAAAPLMGEWQLISLEVMLKRWNILKDLYDAGEFTRIQCETKGPVKPEWWIPSWLPLAYNGAGDYQCLDMSPATGGEIGQIISFWHVIDRREVLAKSFRKWLQTFADDLENGQYKYESGELVKSE